MIVQDSLSKVFVPIVLLVALLAGGMALMASNFPGQQAGLEATRIPIHMTADAYELMRPQLAAQSAATATAQVAQAQAQATEQAARAQAQATVQAASAQATAIMYVAQAENAATATAIAQTERAEWGQVARSSTVQLSQALIVIGVVVGLTAFFVRFAPKIYATYQNLKWLNPQFRLRMRQAARAEELRQRVHLPYLALSHRSTNGHHRHKLPLAKETDRHTVK